MVQLYKPCIMWYAAVNYDTWDWVCEEYYEIRVKKDWELKISRNEQILAKIFSDQIVSRTLEI